MKFGDLKVEPSFIPFNNFILANLINKTGPLVTSDSVTKARYVQSKPIKYLFGAYYVPGSIPGILYI